MINNAEQTTKIEKSSILHAQGYFPYRDLEKLIAAYNKNKRIYQSSAVAKMPTNTTAIAAAEQLKQIYKAATKEQRKAFRIWLLEQDMQ